LVHPWSTLGPPLIDEMTRLKNFIGARTKLLIRVSHTRCMFYMFTFTRLIVQC
jgi:hypothetical protein